MLERFVLWLDSFFKPKELFIDLERVNREARKSEVDDAREADYRARVKRRMVEGLTKEELAPLIIRGNVVAFKKGA
jgi:hypothetical protein